MFDISWVWVLSKLGKAHIKNPTEIIFNQLILSPLS